MESSEDTCNNHYGPSLPPQMKKQKQDEEKTDPSNKDNCIVIGPELPPGMKEQLAVGRGISSTEETGVKADHYDTRTESSFKSCTEHIEAFSQIGPALPPCQLESQMRSLASVKHTSSSQIGPYAPEVPQIGPALPPGFSSSGQDDIKAAVTSGPSLPPVFTSSNQELPPSPIGPALPPGFKSSDQELPPSHIGPALPPGFKSSAMELPPSNIGPALPPGFKSSNQELPPSYIRPVLPPGLKSSAGLLKPAGPAGDVSDDTIGPLPSEMASGCTSNAAAEFEERAQRMKDLLTEQPSTDSGPASRETWMTELPSQLSKSIGLNLKTRNFRKRDVPDSERDTSGWTDTPADREKKAKEKEKKRMIAEENQHSIKSTRDEKYVKEKKKHKKSKHKESLLEMHQKERKKKKEDGIPDGVACLLPAENILVGETGKASTSMFSELENHPSMGPSAQPLFSSVSCPHCTKHSCSYFSVPHVSSPEQNAEVNCSDMMSYRLCSDPCNVFVSGDETKIVAEKSAKENPAVTELSGLFVRRHERKHDSSDIPITKPSLVKPSLKQSIKQSVHNVPETMQTDSCSVLKSQKDLHSISESKYYEQSMCSQSAAESPSSRFNTSTSITLPQSSSSHRVPNNTMSVHNSQWLMASTNCMDKNDFLLSRVKNIYKNLADFSLSSFEEDLFNMKMGSQISIPSEGHFGMHHMKTESQVSTPSKDYFEVNHGKMGPEISTTCDFFENKNSLHKTCAIPWLRTDSCYSELPTFSSWTLPLTGLSGDAAGTSTAIHHINTKMDTILEILKDTKQHLMTIENERLKQVSDRLDRIEQCLRKAESQKQGHQNQSCSVRETQNVGQQNNDVDFQNGPSKTALNDVSMGFSSGVDRNQLNDASAGFSSSVDINKSNDVNVGFSSVVDRNKELSNHAMFTQQPAFLTEKRTGKHIYPLPRETRLQSDNGSLVNPELPKFLTQKPDIPPTIFPAVIEPVVQGSASLNQVSAVQKESAVKQTAFNMMSASEKRGQQVILPVKQNLNSQKCGSVTQNQNPFKAGSSQNQSFERIYLPQKLTDLAVSQDTSWSLGLMVQSEDGDSSRINESLKIPSIESGTDAESSSGSEMIRKQAPGSGVRVPVVEVDSIKLEVNSDGDDTMDDEESSFFHLDEVFPANENTGQRLAATSRSGQGSAGQHSSLAGQGHEDHGSKVQDVGEQENLDSVDDFCDSVFGKNPNCADYSMRTVKADRRAAKLFRRYLKKKRWPENFEKFEPSELCKCLCHFFMDVRKEDGEVYKESSLQYFRYGLNRYLRSAPFNREFDITRDVAFKRVAKCYKDAIRNIRATGKVLNHHPIISDQDRQKLYNSCYMNINTPQGLLNKVQFDIRMYLCRGDSMEMMTKSTFIVTTHPVTELRCVRKAAATKEFMCEAPGSPFCPVLSYEKYLAKLSPQSQRLWQYPQPSFEDDNIWYNGRPVGRGKMEKFMADLSKKCKLSRCYTNQSIKTTGNAIMSQLAFGMAPVVPVTTETTVMQIVNPSEAEGEEGEGET